MWSKYRIPRNPTTYITCFWSFIACQCNLCSIRLIVSKGWGWHPWTHITLIWLIGSHQNVFVRLITRIYMEKKRSVLIGRTNRKTDKMAINLLGTRQKRRIQLEWVKPIFIKNPFLIVCYRNDRFPPFKSWYFEGYNVDVYFSSLGYLWYKWLNNIRRQAWQESGLFSDEYD